MTLRQKQSKFARMVAHLIDHATIMGFEVTLGDAARMDRQGHMPNSCHYIRLAIDLNLFHDGKYLRSSEAHRPLGIFWESLASDARWGGRFTKVVDGHVVSAPDGNHYSLEHKGYK